MLIGDWWARQDKGDAQFLAFSEPLTWRADVNCDGAPARNRAQWLVENKGMNEAGRWGAVCCRDCFILVSVPNLSKEMSMDSLSAAVLLLEC